MVSELVPTIERDFVHYMKSYRKMAFSEERKILFLRDLLVRRVFTKLSFRFRAKVIAYLTLRLFNLTTLISVSKLFIARRKRAKVRFG